MRSLLLLVFLLACSVSREAVVDEGPDPRYWRYDRILTQLEEWRSAYPDLVHLEDIGTTHRGEGIRAARIGKTTDGPVVVFQAALHANEANGTGAIMALMGRLITGYGTDPEVTATVDGLRIWLVPVVNVDGYRHVFSGAAGWREWRKNGRDNDGDGRPFGAEDGVDLNRNWDHRFALDRSTRPGGRSYKGKAPFSEPETRALRDFILRERPLVLVDYHSPGKVTPPNKVFWPWLFRETEVEGPDADVFRPIAQAVAARTETEEDGVFMDGDWYGYDTLPKQQNWVYGKTGSCVLLMEISRKFWWEGEIVDRIAARVATGSFALLERARNGPGLHGRVTNAETGRPLDAIVIVEEHHDDRIGPHRTDPETGEFRRFLSAGPVTVVVRAEGFDEWRRTIRVGGWTRIDVRL